MGMDRLTPAGNLAEQELDQWWRSALAGWARRQQTPAQAWLKIRPGIQAGPARNVPGASSRWGHFLDKHTWVCLVGLCVVVAGLLLSIFSTTNEACLTTGNPIGLSHTDALNGRAVLLAQRSQHAVWLGLSPAQDPLLRLSSRKPFGAEEWGDDTE